MLSAEMGAVMKFLLFFLFPITAFATLEETIQKLQSQSYDTSVANNDVIFNQYCEGSASSADIPRPKYSNPLVLDAAIRLSQTKEVADQILSGAGAGEESQHFYFYYPIMKIYKLSDYNTPSWVPAQVKPVGHNFLTLLCGEFRDRATMIEAKVKWIQNLFILENVDQAIVDPEKNIWSQVSAKSYYSYLQVTASLWSARRNSLPLLITVGKYQVDNPVQPMTVCETKYIFSEYVGKAKSFDSLVSFDEGYKTYQELCPIADREDFYDFRGDANFKHYSPEANAMIWYATGLAGACKNPTTSKDSNGVYTNEDCENYFKKPFHYRFNAARATLATWIFRGKEYDQQFASYNSMVALYAHRKPDLAPYSFSFDVQSHDDIFSYDEQWLQVPGAWNKDDMGFNEWVGQNTSAPNFDLAYERLRDSVDRHTDWYSSGYNDKNGLVRSQANSPFMATSYEMSESNSFVKCGYTVNCPDDGLKRWMFIFRVKPQDWYNPARLIKNEPVDFLTMWLDETSFGNSGLANSEKAWDRMGTCSENELESILYLVNIP
jgi:hypothetical protein